MPGIISPLKGIACSIWSIACVMTGIITGLIRIAHSRALKTSATIRKENRILTLVTVSVQSDLRVLNAGISHGAILIMKILERKRGKVRRVLRCQRGRRTAGKKNVSGLSGNPHLITPTHSPGQSSLPQLPPETPGSGAVHGQNISPPPRTARGC
jgi:hypothetical protein